MAKLRIKQVNVRPYKAPGERNGKGSHLVAIINQGGDDILVERYSETDDDEFHEIPMRVVRAIRKRPNAK